MKHIFDKLTACIISMILITPSGLFAAGEQKTTQKDIARLITSAETPSDKSHGREITLSIMGSMIVLDELPNLGKIVADGERSTVLEFRTEFNKWYMLIKEDYRAQDIAFKNAKEILARKYKKEIDALWPRRYTMTLVEREKRVLWESKLFTLERLRLVKDRGIVLVKSIDNPKIINRFSMEIMGREMVEKTSLDIARAIDISGPHAYMGFSIKNIRETVIELLNDIVKTSYRSVNGSTLDKRVVAAAQAENATKVLARTISTESGQHAFYDFIRTLEYKLAKGGGLAMAAGAVIGIGLLFTASSQASAKDISNSRLAISRELKATLNATPTLLATKVITLKNAYGAPLVSSIIYENKDAMLPLLKKQFANMRNPQVVDCVNELLGENAFDSAKMESEFKRNQVITAVRDNTYVKTFTEKMAPLKLK